MKFLTRDQIISIHEDLINEFGGIHGLRDEGMLDSALSAPFLSFGNQELYPGIVDKAARLCYELVQNHPFLDGNKRIGTMAMLIYLDQNNLALNCKEDELTKIILLVADGTIDNQQLSLWILQHLD